MNILKLCKEVSTNSGVSTGVFKMSLRGNDNPVPDATTVYIRTASGLPDSSKEARLASYYSAYFDNETIQHSITITKSELQYISKAMATRDIRFYLNGVAFYANGGIVATDGHRMHGRISSSLKGAPLIIPVCAIKALISCMDKKQETLTYTTTTGTQFGTFILPDCTIAFTFIDGRFPDVNLVIPKLSARPYVVKGLDHKQLKNDVKPLCNTKYHGIKLTLQTGTIDASNKETGNHTFKNAFKALDESADFEMSIGLNVQYLIDALNNPATKLDGNVSVLDQNTNIRIDYPDTDLMAIVMPMRL